MWTAIVSASTDSSCILAMWPLLGLAGLRQLRTSIMGWGYYNKELNHSLSAGCPWVCVCLLWR